MQKSKSNALVAVLVSAAVLTPGLVFASGPTPPDLSEISALFPVYAAGVVGLIIGFSVAMWSKRAAALTKPG